METKTDERGANSVFISYAREDKIFASDLAEKLKARNIEAKGDWLLTPGEDYEKRLRDFNLRASAFIFIISPDSIASKPCSNELALAVEHKKQILPLSYRDHQDDNLLDSALRAPHWILFREGDDFQLGLDSLVKAVNTDFALMNMHGRLLEAADVWHGSGRKAGYLWRKEELKKAESWLALTSLQPDKLPQPTLLQIEFILAGKNARSRGATIGFGIALSVVLALSILSIVAWAQRSTAVQNAEIASQNERKANEQAAIAKQNENEAKHQQGEAERQEKQANDNLEEAKRQQKEAETQKRKAEDNLQEASRQRTAAEQQTAIAKRNEKMAREAESEARIATEKEKRATNDFRRQLYASNIVLAADAYGSGNTERAQALLDSPSVEIGRENPRGFEWYYLSRLYNRKLASFTAHKNAISSVACSPDGKTLVTGSDTIFKLWDAATQEYLGTLGDEVEDEDEYPADTAAAFSPDGTVIATVSRKGFQLWNSDSRKLVKTLETGDAFFEGAGANAGLQYQKNTVTFSPDGKMIAVGLLGTYQIWNVATLKLMTPPRLSPIYSDDFPLYFSSSFPPALAFSLDSRVLAFSTGDGVKLWDIVSQSVIADWVAENFGGSDEAHSLGFLPGGGLFISGGYENKLVVFKPDAETKKFISLPPLPISKRISKLMFSPDGKTFVTAAEDEVVRGGGVKLWDADSLMPIATFEGLGTKGSVSTLAFSPDGKMLIIGSGNSVQLSSVEAKRSVEVTEPVAETVFKLKTSPDNTTFAALVNGENGYKVKLWNSDMLLLDTFDVGLSELLAFSPDGKTLATGNRESGVSLRDISRQPFTEYEFPLSRPCHTDEFTDYSESAAFSPDGKTLAVGSTYCMQWWDIDERRYLTAPPEYQDYGNARNEYLSVAYSPDGKLLAVINNNETIKLRRLLIIDAASRETLVVVPYSWQLMANSLAFSRDGKSLVVGNGNATIDIWNISSISTLKRDKNIKRWERDTSSSLLLTLEGHTNEVMDIAFSPDGKTLATGSRDTTVKLWSMTTYQLLLTLQAGDKPVNAVAFAQDNTKLLAGDFGGSIKVWRAPR